MKRILSLLVCLLAFSWIAIYGQDVQIRGTITSDEDGSTLPGVYVKIKGTNTGTATDANGQYQLTAPANATLVFSSIGFKDQEIEIAGQSTINVVMSSDVTQMDEVIVTALGIKREKREVTYQTQKVSNDEILKSAPTRAASGLAGKVAGLQINNMDNGVNPSTKITLRGFRSITGSNDATVVIDGSIASLEAFDALNPNDIQEINVLKGANAAALYGSKASNGALIVSTKKGATNQKFTVGINSALTLEKVAYMPKFQSKYGTGWEGAYDAVENTNWGPRFDGTLRQIGPTWPDGSYQAVPYAPVKDNLLDFFETGNTISNTAYVSGGDNSSTYYISAGQQKTDGIVPEDEYKRYTFRANATKRIGKLEVSFNSSFFTDHTDVVGNEIGDQDRQLYWFLLNTSANIPLSKYKNWRTDLYATPDGYYNAYYQNPYWAVGTNRDIEDSRRLMGNIAVSYDLLPWMKLTVRGAMNNSWSTGKDWRAFQDYDPDLQPSHTTVSSFVEDMDKQTKDYNFDAILAVDRDLTEMISLKVNLGAVNQTQEYRLNQVRANNLSIPDFYDISNGTGTPDVTIDEWKYINYGFFGDITVGYGQFLFLNFAGRNDWTSTLPKKNNSYFYPSFGLSFVLTDAVKSLQNNILSFAKITLSNATVYNDLKPYEINEKYEQQVGFPFGELNGFALGLTTVDANIKKERLNTTEVGLDLGFLNNRLSLDVTYFDTKTTDLITSVTPSVTSGATGFRTNIGELSNKGVELTLGGRILELAAGLTWDINLNYTTNTTKVVKITDDVKEVALTTVTGAGIYAIEGEVLPTIKAMGYIRDPQGRLVIDPATGYPRVATEFIPLGRTLPKHIYGLNSSLGFKGFSVSATFDYRTGHVYFEQGSDQMEFTGRSLQSVSANRQDFVIPNSVIETSPGVYVENTNIPVANGRQSYWTDTYNDVKENYVKDASALKIRELAVDYAVPAKFLSKTFINTVRVGFVARNLKTWLPPDNHFADPEFGNSYTNPNAVGIGGFLQAPPTRSFGFTLNLEF